MNNIRHIDWYQYNETVLNPIALVVTLSMGVLIIIVEKKYIIIPILIVILYIPYIQRIVIAKLDFDMVRILILFGLIRIVIKKEQLKIRWNRIDKLFFMWVIVTSIAYILLRRNSDAIINRLGFLFNAIGIYILMRISINGFEDVYPVIKVLALLSILVALAMLVEQFTSRNYFYIFGGVPKHTHIREGRLRSQGAFPHAILAGTFGASLIPYCWGLWWKDKKSKKIALLGFISGIIITVTSSSSGPIMTLLAGLLALGTWLIRDKIRIVRWSVGSSILFLHLIMEAPVWALIWRVGVVGGSTGYHRYLLIDQFIKRITEWWLLGIETTAYWGYGLQDVTNMFVRAGINGGLFALILFILTIWYCFIAVGKIIVVHNIKMKSKKVVWSLGCVMFAHVISFLGVTYAGNMIYFFYLTIILISSLHNYTLIDKDKMVATKIVK